MGLPLVYEKFDLQTGWFQRFKDYHNVFYWSIHGESGEADVDAMNDWIEGNVTNILNKYAQSDIYNSDESRLFYQMLPSKIMEISDENFEGGKAS